MTRGTGEDALARVAGRAVSEAVRGRVAAGHGPHMLGSTTRPAADGQPYTVGAVNALAKELLEGALPPLWVAGEATGWKRYRSSGHCYFSLRDADAQLRCVMFRSDAQRLPTDPREGMQVRALGRLTVYPRRGDFQLVVAALEAQGAGGLWRLAFERLKAKLEGEGLLAPERRRRLPRHPARVGVVTSPAGAALHDIVQVIGRRAPWTRIVLAPARVQGAGAAEEIAAAIRRFARSRLADVLIVGRGGGSVEDLWAFNEEVVARAIAESPIPVVSAVGHEVDISIADLVADARAATPSAAAETVVPDRQAVARELTDLQARTETAVRRRLAQRRDRLTLARDGLSAGARLAVGSRRDRLAGAAAKLEALSPLAALRRGYAVPLDEAGRILRRAAQFEPESHVRLRVADGSIGCRVEDVRPDGAEEGTGTDG